ncbi:MAG: ABC transporter ATP-binding protein [Methanosarcinaceae archaeon]|nr:ABC transporter ATP-binding protein [Methanosarcinaceae archaeon]
MVFKKFLSYYKPYKSMLFLDIFCALLISLIDLSYPQILRFLTQKVYVKETEFVLSVLPYVIVVLLIMYSVRALSRYYVTSYGHIMGAKMESDMRRDLFEQYQRLSFSYYDKNKTGDMMSRISADLFDISELAHHGPENIILSLLTISGSFILLMFINIPMTVILFLITCVLIIFSLRQQKKMRAVFMDNRRKISDINSSVQDSLEGIRVVKTFANESIEMEKFEKSNRAFLDSKKSSYYAMGTFHSGNNFLQGMLYSSVLISGGYFIATGSLAPYELAFYALYISIFINPIEVLVNFTESFQKGFAGFKRFYNIMQLHPDIKESKDAIVLKDVKGEIFYNNVSFSYENETKVLNDLNISISPGEKVALVGPSGSGKSTICSLLPRFYDVNSGYITIDGKDIRCFTLSSLRKSIGIVQQDIYLFSGSIKMNIAYGKPDATDEEITKAAKNAGIHDFIISLPDGYETFVGERGTRLSGGQKQRISIARVFLKNPPILILDEATSSLDNESERHVQNSLNNLSKNRTTIVIAHRLSTIRNADKILVLTDEGIEESGSHEELLKKDGLYAKYYNMQFEVGS